MEPYSREWWSSLVDQSVAASDAFRADVVDWLMEHSGACVWHAVAVVANAPCFCVPCRGEG